jgi:glycosyltransferase involved in cell wall biosynthesis
MKQPIVTVIVPTRNSASTLAPCLASIKHQDYPAIELIVVDNSSTDSTVTIARHYTPLVCTYGPERSAQRNFGAALATGKYILMVDSDMELDPHVVSACLAEVNNRPGCQAVIIPEESFGEGYWAECKRLERSFYHGIDWVEAARFFDTSLYRTLGGYTESMVSGEDWDLSQRAGLQTKIGRVEALIHHNEGRVQLVKDLKKKYYYAGQFKTYTAAASQKDTSAHGANPTGIVLKRFWLFLSQPRKLFSQPHVGLGMLFMKVCEFGFGAFGYLNARRGVQK